jgi:hypothetical protein
MNARDAINLLKNQNFDPRIHFTIDAPLETELVPATQASLIWEKNRIRVSARSSKTSLLVIPLEFSNTLRIHNDTLSKANPAPRLLRVNVALTGVLFSGTLEATIVPQFGPFGGAMERFMDYYNAKDAGF